MSVASISNGSVGGTGDEELAELDPDEFDLPSIETQTLEDILREDASHLLFDEDLLDTDLDETVPISDGAESYRPESSVPASFVTNASRGTRDWRSPPRRHPKSALVRFSRLRGVSSQLSSATERVNAGNPSSLAVYTSADPKRSLPLIAVGTTHGVLMLFDATNESLKFSVGSKTRHAFGSVSSMAFSKTGGKLLVGFSKGHVQLVDTIGGRVLITLQPEQAHQPGRGVLHVVFMDNSRVAVVVDSGGSVFHIRFQSGLMGLTHRLHCVFSGCHGEVCTVCPLSVPARLAPVSKHYGEPMLLAMATVTKVMVVRLKPPAKIVFVCELSGPPQSPPLLAWQWVPIQVTAKLRVVDPVLTFCRGSHIYFYQLHTADGETFRSFPVHNISLPVSLINLKWCNARCILALDDSETLHLYEVGSGPRTASALLASVDTADAKLVYSSGDFKGLATGGNVSEALACLADRTCYQSLVGDDSGKIFLLGVSGVFAVVLRSWLERVEGLRDSNDLPGAIQLGIDFLTGRQKVGTSATRVGSGPWRTIIANKVADLLVEYVDRTLGADCPVNGKVDALLEHFRNAIPVCIEGCVVIKRYDLLYDEMHPRFSRDSLAKGLFLECLEEKLLDQVLPDVPPIIIQDYLNHLAQEGMLSAVESSIVRLPIDRLDLHQVMTMCRTHGLYDGIIYVYNKALNDFLTPVEEMLEQLEGAMAEHADMLTDEEIQLGNKILLYVSCCLCGRAYPIGSLETKQATVVSQDIFRCITSLRGKDGSNASTTYPYLKLLLKFDAREFLNVLTMSSQAPVFSGDDGNDRLQKLVDILLQIVLSGQQLLTTQLGVFLTFVARLTVQEAGRLTVGADKFHQLLEAVLSADNQTAGTSVFEERQQAVLELLQTAVARDMFDFKLVLSWAEHGRYLQVCEFLYWQRREYDRVLDCYLDDKFRQVHVFALIRSLLSSTDIGASEKLAIKQNVQIKMPALAAVDATQAAHLVLDYFVDSIESVLGIFTPEQASHLYEFMAAVFSLRRIGGHRNVTEQETVDKRLVERFVRLLSALPDAESRVVQFLREWEALCEDNDTVLRICRENGAIGPCVMLLERRGEYGEAYELMSKAMLDGQRAHNVPLFVTRACETLLFCQRCSAKVPSEKLRVYWCELFDLILRLPNEQLKKSTDVKDLLSQVVHAMIGFVTPAKVLEQLFAHSAFQHCAYSEHEDLIASILQGYEYEQVLLANVVSIVEKDAHSLLCSIGRDLHRPPPVVDLRFCVICGSDETVPRKTAVVFECGHVAHVGCMGGTEDWQCACNEHVGDKRRSRAASAADLSMPSVAHVVSLLPSPTMGTERRALEKRRLLATLDDAADPFAERPDDDSSALNADSFRLRLAPPRDL